MSSCLEKLEKAESGEDPKASKAKPGATVSKRIKKPATCG